MINDDNGLALCFLSVYLWSGEQRSHDFGISHFYAWMGFRLCQFF